MGAEAEGEKMETKPNPISEAQFLSWKRQKDAEASARKAEAARKRSEDIAAGTVQMNGRELFQHEPWVFDNSSY
ncbi:zinc finger CCCH domain-containing protein 15 homolog [Rhodamnia argentea]|uniref:Zinc finger CCCH domain-containing protein 15 homolog n=1 Tax=Rhodamnia argentea TaxID=178133 RepID=A0A8B8Q384_9MYRT|nr:zinc finger CCCH domain-containing protein 15 homolog [Rhodamnia argentea]